MTLLVTIAAALGFFALVMASIALHELGHLVPAKAFGIHVPQYFVGFGKTVWSRTIRGTQCGIKALPLGGYVRLVGMYPPARVRSGRPGWLTRWADEARAAEHADLSPADEGHLFHEKRVWQRIVVMAGGPLMNLLLAFVIFCSINALHGQYRSQLVADTVSECVIPASQQTRTCTAADPLAPARAMGIRPGDRITSFNSTALTSWEQLSELIRANGARPATVVVEREGKPLTLPTRPTILTGVADRLDPSRTIEAGFLGVGPRVELVRGGPVQTARDMWLQTRQSVVALAGFPVKTWHVLVDLVTGAPRDATGPVSIVGASRVAGEIATSQQMSLGDRIASWFSLLGQVNLFVCLLNCVPLPPLDGGHIAGALYEGLRRAIARLLGRPDPGPVDTARLLPVAWLVGGFLALAGAVLVLADVFSPVRIP